MQPHQFSYCSCFHLSKTRAKLYTSDSWGTVELKSVRTRARSKSLSPSKPNPPIHAVGLPSALLSLAVKVQAAGLGRPAPAPSTPESGIPALSPSAVHGWRWLSQAARPPLSPDPRKHGAKWAKFPQSPNSSAPKKGAAEACCPASLRPRRRVWDPKAWGAAGGEGRGGGGAPRERSDAVQTLGTKWPHCTPTAEPGLLAKWRTEGWEWSPQVASRARGAWAGEPGTAPLGRILTTRRGRAAQPQCQQRPQRSGAQGGHLLVRLLLRRRRLGRSTWGGGPDRGAPTFSSPPPTSAAHGLARRPEAQTSVSPLPAPQVRRSWAAATAAARSLAETFSGVQRSSLVCPSASAASSHLKPRPAVAAARPRRLRHPGVSRRKKRRPGLRAEGSTMSPQTPPQACQPASSPDAP